MTRVVVQRSLNASSSSQSRQSSSAPSSTNVSIPSSTNSSTASHPPIHSSSLSVAVPYQEDAVQGGKETELVNSFGEDNANFKNELGNKLAPSSGFFEGKASERYHTYLECETAEDASLTQSGAPEETLEGVREGERGAQLTHTYGEFSEGVVPVGGQELEKGKEHVEEGRVLSSSPDDERHGACVSEYSAVVQSGAVYDSSSERNQDDETKSLREVQIGLQTSAPKPLLSSSSQPLGAPTAPPFHNWSHSSSDIAPAHEPDQARPNSSHSLPEAVGCSYVSSSLSSPLLSSSTSRRGSWLGSSPAPPRGGFSRRGSRLSKPSRNSPNSSRPSSPRSYGEGDGYNSADEQNSRSSPYENNEEREHQFEVEIRCAKNLEVRRMAEDGNCLFRAVADQVYGDAEMYDETRQMCIDYMEKERDHFSQFVTESFTAYCKRKRRDKVYGNNLEIQAMAEMYNRPIHIYSYSPEPINIFHGSYETDLPPIRLSYHRGNHYNSLLDPRRPAVGAGLGFGSLRGANVDREQVKAALKAQQDQQIDKALLAEGRFYSDIELTEQEIQRMVMEASRAEFFEEEKLRHYAPWSEETSTSAAAEPSSSGTTGSPKSATRTMSLAATSTAVADSAGLTPNMRMLMSMGFSYLQVMEASSIFGDDVNNMLCYLLETENSSSGDGESMYRKKGKAAER